MHYRGGLAKLSGFVAAAALSCCVAAARDTSEAAKAVLERTKTTTSTYSLYLWNRITRPGEPAFEEGSAEFHKGNLHRVETPRDRVVADCKAKLGFYLSSASVEIVEGPKVAAAACGIDTNSPFLSIELLPDVPTRFGTAQRVRVVDANTVREYDVLGNGALVRATYTENRPGGSQLIVSEAVRLENTVPDDAIFSRDSLAKSFLPKDLKR